MLKVGSVSNAIYAGAYNTVLHCIYTVYIDKFKISSEIMCDIASLLMDEGLRLCSTPSVEHDAQVHRFAKAN
jgi:hypothetical protein